MKRSSNIVHESQKKKIGRPRINKDDDVAAAITVRLTPKVLAVVDDYAAEMGGLTRSKALRDMINHAVEHWAKMKKRRKPQALFPTQRGRRLFRPHRNSII